MNNSSSDDESIKGILEPGVSFSDILELLDPISINFSTNRFISGTLGKDRIAIKDLKEKSKKRFKSIDLILQNVFFKDTNALEKAFYPFTLFNIYLIGLIMGKFPEWFHIYYTCLFALLMPIRFYTYYKTNNHYYMADLCYFVNFMCLIYIWALSKSVNLYQSCFAFTFGSLSFAVITWRNSIVIHSVDKITSCFIHIMPPCTFYVIHHGLPREFQAERFPAVIYSLKHDAEYWDFKYNIIWTSFYYLVWQMLYHYFITLRKSSKIKSGQRMTSFVYLFSHNFKNSWVAKLPEPYPMIVYTFCQYCYQLTTMSSCRIWFNSKLASEVFLTFIFLFAAHNGATYYIDHYGKKFEKELKNIRQELEALQQQNSMLTSNRSEKGEPDDIVSILTKSSISS